MSEQFTPRVEQIDPQAAIIGSNVRLDARVDREFLNSVKTRGVLVPVVATVDEEGRYVIRYGQRRTLAAAQAGIETIPAYVVASTDEADRIIDQLAENDHRAGVTTGERVAALATLAGLGLTAAQIAKQTGSKKADVETALTVAGSALASKAAERFDYLTLDQAATLAEFEADVDAVKVLTVAAKEGQFDHVAQRLRDDRERAARTAEAVEALTAEGTTVLPTWDSYGEHKAGAQLGYLIEPGDKKRTPLTAETHKGCPGHAAYVRTGWDWKGNTRHAVADAIYVCTAWRKNGHAELHASTSSKPSRDEMSEEQREAAKAERRDVIESNKAWDAAEATRREWVTGFLTRRAAPKGSTVLIAQAIASSGWSSRANVDDHKAHEVAKAFGIDSSAEALTKVTDGRAAVLALGQVLAGYEAQTGRQSWRSVHAHTSLYLRFLAANGYALTEVEKRAAGLTRKGKRAA